MKKLIAVILAASLIVLPALADGDVHFDFTLPAALKTIGEEAFYGIAAEAVMIPEGVEAIEARAFAASAVRWISLPASLTRIADDAFPAPDGSLFLAADEGTYACDWAGQHGYRTHVHSWVDVTETVAVPEEGHWETVHYEAGTHTETIEHPEEGHYETVKHPAVTHTETVQHAEEGHWETVTIPAVQHTVHHDAVTHEEQKWVVDKAAWTETEERKLACICNGCGRYFFSYNDYIDHWGRVVVLIRENDTEGLYKETSGGLTTTVAGVPAEPDHTGHGCGSFGSAYINVPLDEPIEHPEEGHYETVTVTDSPAWDEIVTDTPVTSTMKWVIDQAAWTETVTVTDKAAWEEKVWKVDQAAWTETVTVTDATAHDEQVWVVDKKATTQTVAAQHCEVCGETRKK